MTALPGGFPISLRTWPSKSTDTADLPTFFQRVNAERGGLLRFTEDSLREEIAKEDAGEVVDDESEEELDKAVDEVKARAAAREELLQHIGSAHQAAMFQLEFISLLLSKENPAVASQTISAQLRERVGLGTLGAAKASTSWTSAEQREDNKLVARGWKTRDVNKAIDSILESATRLETEIEKETRYWEELLDLSDQSWNICKVPGRKGVMGVRLGSQEASPVLRSQGLAVLSRNESGSLYLNPDPITADPKVLRIRIKTNGELSGTSSIPSIVPKTDPVQNLLLQTRNTLFALELWHEINRESRSLGAFSITTEGSTLVFPLTSTKTAILDLFSLSDATQLQAQPEDSLAHGLSLSLHHLLAHSHRQSLRRRSLPQKPKPNPKRLNLAEPARNKLPNPMESALLLRPVLTALNHQTSLSRTQALFRILTETLQKSSLPFIPTYEVTQVPPNLPPHLSGPERVIATLTNHLSTLVVLKIAPDVEVKVMLRTAMLNLPFTLFNIQISPDTSDLARTCPSPGMVIEFGQLEAYILLLSSAAVAHQFIKKKPLADDVQMEDSTNTEEEEGWKPTHYPSTLRFSSTSSSTPEKAASNDKLLTFSLHTLPISTSPPSSQRSPSTTSLRNGNAGIKPVNSRKGLKLRITYLHDSEFETGGFKGVTDDKVLGDMVEKTLRPGKMGDEDGGKRKKMKDGEGCYEWVVWEDDEVKVNGRDADGDDELSEVVKSASEIVALAERG